jgi:hypothetical protein
MTRHQLIAAPADPSLGRALPASAAPSLVSEAMELTHASDSGESIEEAEDDIPRWFVFFYVGWGLVVLFLRYF